MYKVFLLKKLIFYLENLASWDLQGKLMVNIRVIMADPEGNADIIAKNWRSLHGWRSI